MSNTLMELRKCCNHPYLLKGIEDSLPALATAGLQAALERMVAASGKLDLIDKMLAKMIPRGHRMLIYSQFTTVLNILEDWLIGRGWGFQRIDGAVSKLSCYNLESVQRKHYFCLQMWQVHLSAYDFPVFHTTG